MSVVKPVRQMLEPDDLAPRLSQELPSQAIGPCTRWATSVSGCSAILAPSKAHPPAAPPGCNCLVQPFFRSASDLLAFLLQPGSLKTSWMVADSEVMIVSFQGPQHAGPGKDDGRADVSSSPPQRRLAAVDEAGTSSHQRMMSKL